MTPTQIEWVELSTHAERDRLPDLDHSVNPSLITECVQNLRGRIYKDTDRDGHHYRMAVDEHEITICYAVEFDLEYNNKYAAVKTVFPSDRNWWDMDRFELWNGRR